MSSLKSAVWFTTMACNFSCNYCWEVQGQARGEFEAEPFQPAGKWIEAWKRLSPEVLDITGGEPFLQPGLVDIIVELASHGTRLAITSNLSHPLLEFVQKVDPEKLFSITASFHPSQNGSRQLPMNTDLFLGRCLLLREHGFNVTVNFVAWPEQVFLIPKYASLFGDEHGFRFHVEPYSAMSYYPWTGSEAESRLLDQWIEKDRRPFDDPPAVLCSAGCDHLSVQPDGSAWRCLIETKQRLNPLGNIFDKHFGLLALEGRRPCFQRRNCQGCDRDKVSVEKSDIAPV